MELNIDRLTIEVTRKCNMNCEHCLRGASQRKTIDNLHIHKIFNLIDSVYSLTISGGEPTLAMDSLEHIVNCIDYDGCSVGDFYIVTNGKTINVERMARWVNQMYRACDSNEISMVGFSFDPWHRDTFNWQQAEKQERNYNNLKEMMEFEYGIGDNGCDTPIISKHSDETWRHKDLISEGRGANGLGTRELEVKTFEQETYNESISFSETTLYLSSNGWLVAGSNWSYKSIDKRKDIRIAHIDDLNTKEDLINALKAYNVKHGVEEEQTEEETQEFHKMYQQMV